MWCEPSPACASQVALELKRARSEAEVASEAARHATAELEIMRAEASTAREEASKQSMEAASLRRRLEALSMQLMGTCSSPEKPLPAPNQASKATGREIKLDEGDGDEEQSHYGGEKSARTPGSPAAAGPDTLEASALKSLMPTPEATCSPSTPDAVACNMGVLEVEAAARCEVLAMELAVGEAEFHTTLEREARLSAAFAELQSRAMDEAATLEARVRQQAATAPAMPQSASAIAVAAEKTPESPVRRGRSARATRPASPSRNVFVSSLQSFAASMQKCTSQPPLSAQRDRREE